jgi:hypothetical protein
MTHPVCVYQVEPRAPHARPSLEDELDARAAELARRREDPAIDRDFAMNRCDATLGPDGGPPEVVFLRRERADGTAYKVRFERGQRCTREAVTTKRVDGRTVRRCLAHTS